MTWQAWVVIVGLASVGGLAAWLVWALLEELAQAHTREREATERLLASWKDGAHIPPPPLPPPPPLEPLPAALRDELSVWEDPQHRMEMEQLMRHQLAAGKSVAAILMDLDRDHS